MRYLSSIIIIFLLASSAIADTHYMGSGQEFTTLRSACAGISGGDTLIIKDGTYSGANNILSQTQMPPSGSSGAYTIIKAENDGGAVFPDGWIACDNVTTVQYIQFEGLYSGSTCTLDGNTSTPSYIKILRCAFTTEVGDGFGFGIYAGSYILIEDCWAWGSGRYNFMAYGDTLGNTHHIVFRRCVARRDRANSTNPIGGFSAYRTQNVAFQNCIVIDGDHDEFWVAYQERAAAFYIHHGSTNTIVDGCIALNHKSYFAGGTPGTTMTIRNSVAWDTTIGPYARMDSYSGTGSADHCTIGDLDPDRDWTSSFGVQMYGGSDGSFPVTNSILNDCVTGLVDNDLTSDYNCLYGNTANYSGVTPGAHDITATNPRSASLLYLPRIESGSALDNSGSSGDIGATVIYKIGTSGTYHGDSGWETVTEDALWPFPNEDRIKSDMAAYSYTGAIYPSGTDTLSGARGFCASGKQLNGTDDITLTSYIWEYLGNQMPSGIYGEEEPSTTSISGGFSGSLQ